MYQDTINPMSASAIFNLVAVLAILVVLPVGLWMKKSTKAIAEENRLAERKTAHGH